MRRAAIVLLLVGCAPEMPRTIDDAAMPDATTPIDAWLAPTDAATIDAGADANDSCVVDYDVGDCVATTTCSARTGYTSTAGLCPGPSDIQCCTLTPDLSTNPPTPTGYRLMMQSEVTSAMTDWAVMILHDGSTYPMFSMPTMTFGTQPVLAIVEWHPPDFLNAVVHRGVTLYVPTP